MNIKKQIEWLRKESHRNSRMQGKRHDDGRKIHSCIRRRTLRGRAFQQAKAADTLEKLYAVYQKDSDLVAVLEQTLTAVPVVAGNFAIIGIAENAIKYHKTMLAAVEGDDEH